MAAVTNIDIQNPDGTTAYLGTDGTLTVEFFVEADASGNAEFVFLLDKDGTVDESDVVGTRTYEVTSGADTFESAIDLSSLPSGTSDLSNGTYDLIVKGAQPPSQDPPASDTTTDSVVLDDDAPTVTDALTAPDGDTWEVGATYDIEWNTGDVSDVGPSGLAANPITLEYLDGTGSWTEIATDLPNDGTYSDWEVPDDLNTTPEVRLKAVDKAGNISSPDSNTFSVTTDNPTVNSAALVEPDGGETLAAGDSFTIEWDETEISDDESGLATNPISLSYYDGTNWTEIATGLALDAESYNWTVPDVATTGAKVKLTAKDRAGNTGSTESSTFEISYVDSTPPSVSIDAPVDGSSGNLNYISGDAFTIKVTATDGQSGISNLDIEYSTNDGSTWSAIDTGVNPDSGVQYTYDWDTESASVSDEKVWIKATVKNGVGATESNTVKYVYVDNAAPTGVSIDNPASGDYLSGDVTVEASASDAGSGVASLDLEYSVDGGSNWTDLSSGSSSPYETTLDTTTLSDTDQFQLRLTATDNQGNEATSTETGMYIDNTAPTAAAPTAPASGDNWKVGAAETIEWTSGDVSDDNLKTNPISLYYSTDAGSSYEPIVEGTSTGGSYSWDPVEGPTTDNAVIKLVVEDKAGNTAEATSDTFTIFNNDTSAPSVSLSSVPSSAGNKTVKASASDDQSGINKVEFKYSTDGGDNWTTIGTDEFPPDGDSGNYSVDWFAHQMASVDIKAVATNGVGMTNEDSVSTSITGLTGVMVDDDADESWYDDNKHYDNIQDAVDVTAPGNTVIVKDGTYDKGTSDSDARVLIDKKLTLQANTPGDGTKPVIDATAKGSAVKVWSNNVDSGTIEINGFEITGAGIFARKGQSSVGSTTLNVKNNDIHDAAVGFNAWGFNADEWGNRVYDVNIEENLFYNIGDSSTEARGVGVLLEHVADDTTVDTGTAVFVLNNEFRDIYDGSGEELGTAVAVTNQASTKSAANVEVSSNEFDDISLDVYVSGNAANTLIQSNDFGSGNIGVYAKEVTNDTVKVNAEGNWWGHVTGPSGEGTGSGDEVSVNVDFRPYLDSADIETASEVGFSTFRDMEIEKGWQMVSVGFEPELEPKANLVFGGEWGSDLPFTEQKNRAGDLYYWDGGYHSGSTVDPIEPTKGMWLYSSDQVNKRTYTIGSGIRDFGTYEEPVLVESSELDLAYILGPGYDVQKDVTWELEKGWNMISTPFNVGWDQVKVNGTPTKELVGGVASPYLVTHDPENSTRDDDYVFLDWKATMRADVGYWYHTNEAVTIEIPYEPADTPDDTEPASANLNASVALTEKPAGLPTPPAPPKKLEAGTDLSATALTDADGVTFEVTGGDVQAMKVQVFNANGADVYANEVSSNSLQWDAEVANGVYLYGASAKVDGDWKPLGIQKLLILE